VRIVWRLSNLTPELPSDLPAWQRASYQNTSFLLYALMIIFPLSGALMSLFHGHDLHVLGTWTVSAFAPASPDLAHFFNRVHYVAGYACVALVMLHVAGALYHHWILKDHTLKRMWRGS
jgi:cytochrome b561